MKKVWKQITVVLFSCSSTNYDKVIIWIPLICSVPAFDVSRGCRLVFSYLIVWTYSLQADPLLILFPASSHDLVNLVASSHYLVICSTMFCIEINMYEQHEKMLLHCSLKQYCKNRMLMTELKSDTWII